jgi:hypothetical protein
LGIEIEDEKEFETILKHVKTSKGHISDEDLRRIAESIPEQDNEQ